VIPLWLPVGTAISEGEIASGSSPTVPDGAGVTDDALESVLSEFKVNPSIGVAADAVSTAVALGQPRLATEAADYLRGRSGQIPVGLQRALDRHFGSERTQETLPAKGIDVRISAIATSGELGRDIARLRGLLSRYERDPLGWLELARLYLSLGHIEKARRAMISAVTLAPQSRSIVRRGVRFFVHTLEFDVAHDLLRRNRRTNSDPWLMAAEIAVSVLARRPPRSVRPGRAALASGDHSDRDLSELASALGSLEVNEGSTRQARRLIRRSLVDPTMNSIAQAEWIARDRSWGEDLSPASVMSASAEASAFHTFQLGDWQSAADAAVKWLGHERFSSRAASVAGLAVGLGLERWDDAARIAEIGIVASPHDPYLLNSRAFAAIERRDFVQAAADLARATTIATDDRVGVVLRATRGLLAFRQGLPSVGRESYESAVRKAIEISERRLAVLASAYWLAEEVRAGLLDVTAELEDVEKQLRIDPDGDARLALARLDRAKSTPRPG
jgi:Flp pilus assembly protein TadD